jgi:hypothetical protein
MFGDRKFIGETAAARRIGVALPTLRTWRSRGRGPAYYKTPTGIIYDEVDLRAWARGRRIDPVARKAEQNRQPEKSDPPIDRSA